jgi:DNA-binding transcriptional regulator GbsR (MarR family)
MAKRAHDREHASAAHVAERRFAEEMGIVGEQVGMPPMVARVLGWLLICDPPQQSISEMAAALGVSRASISIATRLLEAPRWIRRTPVPGARGYYFEIVPDSFTHMPAAEMFSLLRRTLERGLEALPDPTSDRAARLREAHHFYAYVEREVPRMIERYRSERDSAERKASR